MLVIPEVKDRRVIRIVPYQDYVTYACLTWCEFLDEINMLYVLEGAKQADDVRVIERRVDLNLPGNLRHIPHTGI